MANLYDKAGLVNIPVGYQDGFLYNIKPTDNTLGFRFNRDSAATRVNKEGLIEQVGYFGPELVQNGNFEQIGSELVTNGDFETDTDWTLQGGWSIANGKLTANNATGYALQVGVFESGISKTYKINLSVSDYVSGYFTILTSGGTSQSQQFNANGNYTIYFNSNSPSGTTFHFTYFGSFTGSIDNLSVKEVGQNWSFGTGWSIEDGKAVKTPGTGSSLFQNVPTTTIGKKYKFTFDAIVTGGVANATLYGVTIPIFSTSGSQEHTIIATSTTGFIFYGDSSFEGSIDNVSVVEVKGDKPRIDYTDSLTSPSFLLEPQSTNLVTFSEDFSKWLKQSGGTGLAPIITSNNAISPDGTQNADKIVFNKGTGVSASDLSIIASNSFASQSNTTSFYIKADSPQKIVFRNSTNWQLVDVTTEWQRISKTDTGGGVQIGLRDGYGVSGIPDTATIYLWGVQAEALPYATSYIPTAGSTATRAQETCVGAGSASTFNDAEGVLYAEIAALANDNTYRFISASSGAYANSVRIGYFTTSNVVEFRVVSGGVSQGSLLYTLPNATDIIKIAGRYKQNDFSLWVNGTKVVTDTSGNVPVGLSELAFDDGNTSNNSPFYGKTKGVYVFNEALTDDELQQLTGPEYNSFAALAAAYNYTVI